MFKRKQNDKLISITEELDLCKGILHRAKEVAESLLLPPLEPQSYDRSPLFYRYNETFGSGALQFSCYTERNDYWGGDFFICQTVAPHRIFIALIEPMGRGPSAALISCFIKGRVEAHLALLNDANPAQSLEKICKELNESLMVKFLIGFGVSMTALIIDAHSGQIWVSAWGKESPFIIRTNGAIASLPLAETPSLGFFDEAHISAVFDTPVKSFKLAEGDTIVLINDVFNELQTDGDHKNSLVLKPLLAAANRRSNCALPVPFGEGQLKIDFTSLPDTMDLSERLALAFHAICYRIGRVQASKLSSEGSLKAIPLVLQQDQAKIVAALLPELGIKPESLGKAVITIPNASYGVTQSPMVLCLRWTEHEGPKIL